MRHLLSKTYKERRFVWAVGDCDPGDRTEDKLIEFALKNHNEDITVIRHDTGTTARMRSVVDTERIAALSQTYDAAFAEVAKRPGDEYVMAHESDLVSPPNLVERLVATGLCPIAGAVYLTLPNGGPRLFYDTWGYMKDGKNFRNTPPFGNDAWRGSADEKQPIEVDSAGSVLMVPGADIRAGARMVDNGMVSLCKNLREQYGRKIHFDPTIEIEQPADLWSAS